MDVVGTVSSLWRYPASSLAGEPMPRLSISADGVEGDREYGLFDLSDGEIARPDAGPRWHPVPRIMTRLDARNALQIKVPDGEWLSAPGAAADDAVSRYLGFTAAVLRYEPASNVGDSGKALEPRYGKAPIHLLTTASLARLKALHPEGSPDPIRFRPNILIEMSETPGEFPETGWIGRRLSLGELELTVSEPCRRCGFTVIAQQDVENDPEILRTLVRHNQRNIGVYCTVDRAGEVGIGDRLAFL